MTVVAAPCPGERVDIDEVRLTSMAGRIGTRRTGAALGEAMEELAFWLYHFENARQAGDFAGQSRLARQIAGVARLIGLMSVARVASEAATLTAPEGAGGAAGAAVSARLTRMGEASIVAAWDLQSALH